MERRDGRENKTLREEVLSESPLLASYIREVPSGDLDRLKDIQIYAENLSERIRRYDTAWEKGISEHLIPVGDSFCIFQDEAKDDVIHGEISILFLIGYEVGGSEKLEYFMGDIIELLRKETVISRDRRFEMNAKLFIRGVFLAGEEYRKELEEEHTPSKEVSSKSPLPRDFYDGTEGLDLDPRRK